MTNAPSQDSQPTETTTESHDHDEKSVERQPDTENTDPDSEDTES